MFIKLVPFVQKKKATISAALSHLQNSSPLTVQQMMNFQGRSCFPISLSSAYPMDAGAANLARGSRLRLVITTILK